MPASGSCRRARTYYEYALRYATTTSLSAEEIHRLGLEQMAELRCSRGLNLQEPGDDPRERGAIGWSARWRAMHAFIYPNTEQLASSNCSTISMRA